MCAGLRRDEDRETSREIFKLPLLNGQPAPPRCGLLSKAGACQPKVFFKSDRQGMNSPFPGRLEQNAQPIRRPLPRWSSLKGKGRGQGNIYTPGHRSGWKRRIRSNTTTFRCPHPHLAM
ncbi:hypothetical protein NDU88_002982 [Pleurodeles waltl]|uniref:Uncharacterized protein n=1 Tax=Pleurodeles waltl TaxID=8319 RepID=A0AAV7T484_PLEWA|nr:hypothetical protein NDU88_002982 [Pleurodeles waltl]